MTNSMITRRTFLNASIAAGAAGAAAAAAMLSSVRAAEATPAGGPASVIIIRHGEEPPKGPHLNDRGRARAAALSALFPSRFPTPTVMFAAKSSPQSARSSETLAPLAATLGLTVNETFADTQYQTLANTIRTSGTYTGGHVLICWHHATMIQLATALGAPHAPKWPSKQYDHAWRLSFTNGVVTFTDVPLP